MALPAWQATIVNEFGDIIPSPVITVIIEATGLPASLFSNRGGTTPLGSGGVFTAGVGGFAQFFAAPAEYRVTASDAGSGFSQTWDFVVLSGTAATTDIQTSPADTTTGRGVTTDALGANGGPVFDGSTYQPESSLGLGVVRLMANTSGGNVSDGLGLSGVNLKITLINSSGDFFESGIAVPGTWKNITGTVVNDDYRGYFVRIA